MHPYVYEIDAPSRVWDWCTLTCMRLMHPYVYEVDAPLRVWDWCTLTCMRSMHPHVYEIDAPSRVWDWCTLTCMWLMHPHVYVIDAPLVTHKSTSDVQVCHPRHSSAFDLLLIFLCSLIQTLTLTPPPNNALLATWTWANLQHIVNRHVILLSSPTCNMGGCRVLTRHLIVRVNETSNAGIDDVNFYKPLF